MKDPEPTNLESTEQDEAFEWSRPVGWYPPLYSSKNLNAVKQPTLFFLVLGNLLIRTLFYPFSFTLSALLTAYSIFIATFFNIGFLLGGGFSDNWVKATGEYNQIAITRSLWVIFDAFAFMINQGSLLVGLVDPDHAISTLQYL